MAIATNSTPNKIGPTAWYTLRSINGVLNGGHVSRSPATKARRWEIRLANHWGGVGWLPGTTGVVLVPTQAGKGRIATTLDVQQKRATPKHIYETVLDIT